MKKVLIISFLMILIIVSFVSSAEPTKTKILKNQENTEKSLLIGIRSDNFGLRTSSAYMVGELKIKNAVIPLMRILKSDEREEARIMAALSLYKLETPMSIFAVQKAIRFDKSERVRKMCSRFYMDYLNKTKPEEF